MGLLTDFCIAPIEDAEVLAVQPPPHVQYARMYGWKGLDPSKLEQILHQALITLGRSPAKLKIDPPLATEADGAIMIFVVDPQLIDALAALKKPMRVKVASALRNQPEWAAESWGEEDSQRLLEEFSKLSRMAVKAESPVLLYMSL